LNDNEDDTFNLPSYAHALEIEKLSGCFPVGHHYSGSKFDIDNRNSVEDNNSNSNNNDIVRNYNENSNNSNDNSNNIEYVNDIDINFNISSNNNNNINSASGSNDNNNVFDIMIDISCNNNNNNSSNSNNISNDNTQVPNKEVGESSELSRTFDSGIEIEDSIQWDESEQSPPPEYDEFPGGQAFVQAEILRTISSNLNKLSRHIK